FKSLVQGLNRGDFDFAMNGLEITPDRQNQVRFSRPYYIYKQQLVVRADDRRFETLEQYRSLEGMLPVGTMEETAAARLLKRMGIEPKEGYEDPLFCYKDLQAGRLDGVLLDWPMAVAYAKSNPKLRFAGAPFAPGYYAIALRKGNETLGR